MTWIHLTIVCLTSWRGFVFLSTTLQKWSGKKTIKRIVSFLVFYPAPKFGWNIAGHEPGSNILSRVLFFGQSSWGKKKPTSLLPKASQNWGNFVLGRVHLPFLIAVRVWRNLDWNQIRVDYFGLTWAEHEIVVVVSEYVVYIMQTLEKVLTLDLNRFEFTNKVLFEEFFKLPSNLVLQLNCL